jgi:hypothetical protein
MTSRPTYRIGDIGSPIGLTVYRADGETVESQLGSATTLEIIFSYPDDGGTITKTAVVVTDGSDGKMKYVSVDEFFETGGVGTWEYQGHIVIGSGEWYTEAEYFDVKPQLS